jgi:hypothetical protein
MKLETDRSFLAYYSSRRQFACFKATEGLHPPFRAALSHQYSVASYTKLRVLSCLHSPGHCCSCCNVLQFCWDSEACNLVTPTIYAFIQRGKADSYVLKLNNGNQNSVISQLSLSLISKLLFLQTLGSRQLSNGWLYTPYILLITHNFRDLTEFGIRLIYRIGLYT